MENVYRPEGELIGQAWNKEYISSPAGLERAMLKGQILEATALKCDGEMNLYIDLGGIVGIMPRGEAQYSPSGEPAKDIAIITRVGKPVCFKVMGFGKHRDRSCVMLSRREAQKECMSEYLSRIVPGDIIAARVTHLEQFGAFVDIGCGIISLLSVDCISISRISHPSERLACGDSIYTVVKQIDGEGSRFFVSLRELLGTWEENAADFSSGQTVTGIIRSIESYGIFVELTPNLAGLAELRPDVSVGQCAAVYIKSIIPERMKIKLVLIDSQTSCGERKKPRYFIDASAVSHLDSWRYSPVGCPKIIESIF